jgi:hypothetical protein
LYKIKADFSKTVYAYTKTSIGMFEAFISCWDEKYRSNVIRPETVINQEIETGNQFYKHLLFRVHKRHSVVSTVSATVLTSIFGDNFSFVDNSELALAYQIEPCVL